jgi:SulP family sulfate permease
MTFRPSITRWLPTYQRSWLKSDAVSGATVAAVLIPSALSYAAIVGVEPIVGLYTVPLALVAYAIFGGSRLLAVGPDAAVSVLAASTIASVAVGDDDYLEVMLALSLLVGAIFFVFRLLRMGWIADLVPDPVLKGFIQGLVWVTILGQVPALLGVTPEEDFPDFWRDFAELVGVLGEYQTETAILGVGCLIVLIVLKRVAPRVPGSLVVLIGSMVVVAAASLADEGVGVVGEPDGGFFNFGLPSGLMGSQWIDLMPGAIAIVVLGFTESMGAAKSAAQHTGELIDPNEELLALGASNLGSGLSGGYPVTGTLSKTSVAISTGGKTQVGNLVAALIGVLSVIVLRPLFEELASTVLSALIIFAMAGMLDIGYFTRLWRISRIEFLLALLAFLGVLTFGVLPGVAIGVVFALLILAEHLGRPVGMIAGRTPEGEWHDIDVVPDAETIDGLVIYRQETPIVFLNARRTTDQLRQLAREGARVIAIDAGAVSSVDSTGFSALRTVRDELAPKGTEIWLINPSLRKRALIDEQADVLDVTLPQRYETYDEVLDAYQRLDTTGPGDR